MGNTGKRNGADSGRTKIYKPNTGKKGTAVKKDTKNDVKCEAPENGRSLNTEILCIILFAAGLLLFIIIYLAGDSGFLGGFLKSVLKGCLGFGAYALPFIAILWGVVIILGKFRKASKSKIIMSIFLFLTVISFVHVVSLGGEGFETATSYIAENYKNGSLGNGGLLGALTGDFLLKFLGKAGTYLLLCASAIVLLILVTGKSFFDLVIKVFTRIDGLIAERKYRVTDEPTPKKPIKLDSNRNRKMEIFDEEPRPADENRSKASKKAFDYIINEEKKSGRESVDEPKLLLFNGDFKSGKDKREADIRPVNEREGKIIDLRPKLPETDVPPFELDTEAADEFPAVDSEINVRGVGVEGYVPITVTTSGEDFVEAAPDTEKPGAIPSWEHDLDDDEDGKEYIMPPVKLLEKNTYVPSMNSRALVMENSRKLEETLKSFGVEAKVVEVSIGPTVTRYELSPGVGVKVSRISSLADDLALNLAALGLRIEAPIPGKSVVGIEIPNKETQTVFLRDVIDDDAFWGFPSKLSFAVGKDIAGNSVIVDVAKMPHLLIAGATGSGKSVCVNTIIASILLKSRPDEVKMLMIDPKVVELNVYNGIPHLEIPVVTDPMKAAGALNWGVREMNDRYNLFAETGTRDLKGYNVSLAEAGLKTLPQIVIIIDELADLMMTCKNDVEQNICRLAQKARAAGIHLIIATQRPSVDVITGLIKANIPSRLAFAVTSGTDSRTILDMIGAEKLLGKGDMLFSPAGLSKPQRIQGAFISDKEVERLVKFIKEENGEALYDPEKIEQVTATASSAEDLGGDADEFMQEAINFVVEKGKASVSMLQRRFRIGYNRAARLMEELEARGIVGPEDGVKPRKVLKSF